MTTITEIYHEMLKKKNNLPYDEKLIQNVYSSFEDIEKQYINTKGVDDFITKRIVKQPQSELKGEIVNTAENKDWQGYVMEKTGVGTEFWLDYNSMAKGRLKRLERD